MPSPRITFRLDAHLFAQVQARVAQGQTLSAIMHQALTAYLGSRPTAGPPACPPVSDTMSDTLSAILARLDHLEQQIEQQERPVRHRPTARPTESPKRPTARPTPSGYDAAAAYARMQALHAQGSTLAQIASQLTAEGIRTRQGKAWHKSSVAYVLKTYGR